MEMCFPDRDMYCGSGISKMLTIEESVLFNILVGYNLARIKKIHNDAKPALGSSSIFSPKPRGDNRRHCKRTLHI